MPLIGLCIHRGRGQLLERKVSLLSLCMHMCLHSSPSRPTCTSWVAHMQFESQALWGGGQLGRANDLRLRTWIQRLANIPCSLWAKPIERYLAIRWFLKSYMLSLHPTLYLQIWRKYKKLRFKNATFLLFPKVFEHKCRLNFFNRIGKHKNTSAALFFQNSFWSGEKEEEPKHTNLWHFLQLKLGGLFSQQRLFLGRKDSATVFASPLQVSMSLIHKEEVHMLAHFVKEADNKHVSCFPSRFL